MFFFLQSFCVVRGFDTNDAKRFEEPRVKTDDIFYDLSQKLTKLEIQGNPYKTQKKRVVPYLSRFFNQKWMLIMPNDNN